MRIPSFTLGPTNSTKPPENDSNQGNVRLARTPVMAPTLPPKKPSKGVPGADRVAGLLMVMGKPMAARLMKHFEADEIQRVTRSIADLRSVAPQQLDTLVEAFSSHFAGGANLLGNA